MEVERVAFPDTLVGIYCLVDAEGRRVGDLRRLFMRDVVTVHVQARADDVVRAFPMEYLQTYDSDEERQLPEIYTTGGPAWQGTAAEAFMSSDDGTATLQEGESLVHWGVSLQSPDEIPESGTLMHKRRKGFINGHLRAGTPKRREEFLRLVRDYPGKWYHMLSDIQIWWDADRNLAMLQTAVHDRTDSLPFVHLARLADETIVHGDPDGDLPGVMHAFGFVRRPDGAFRPRKAESSLALLRLSKDRPRLLTRDVVRMIAETGW